MISVKTINFKITHKPILIWGMEGICVTQFISRNFQKEQILRKKKKICFLNSLTSMSKLIIFYLSEITHWLVSLEHSKQY